MKSFFQRYAPLLLEGFNEEIKYALIPGSFKPPHKGHYAMFEHYSRMVGPMGKAIISISDPKKAKRLTAEGKEIPASVAKEIIDIYCKNLGNVITEISSIPPITALCNFAVNLDSGIIILGCSKKDDDLKRFRTVKKYLEVHAPQIQVIDPLTTAVDVINNQDAAISASDFRNSFGDRDKMKSFLPNHLSEQEKEKVVNLLLAL